MQQTLLAILALMTVTYFNFNQMRSEFQHEQNVIKGEMEQMAVGVGMQTLEVIRARSFDEATVGKEEQIKDSDKFRTSFGSGRNCEAFGGSDKCDSVGDFHQMEPAIVPFKTPEFDLDFKVEVEVHYVDPSLNKVNYPTFRKEVLIKVQDEEKNPFLDDPIKFSEVLTYY
jgi:hypothetical protein